VSGANSRLKSHAIDVDERGMKLTLFILMIFVPWISKADSKSVDLLWKARGLQAIERLAELNKKKTLTTAENCEKRREVLYSSYAKLDESKELIHQLPGEITLRNIILISDSSEAAIFSIMYANKKEVSSGIKVHVLPKGWVLGAFGPDWNIWAFADAKCTFMIRPDDPLDMHVDPVPEPAKH
jgi:hypothetical protein